ncbi:MAG: EAL domain-containing protein, partial [Caulobacterales bacterium]
AHRKAKMAERRLRLAIDAMPQGVVFLDPDGRYILWNQRYSEIYTKSADLFVPGARMQDTLRIGVERGDYPEAAGREEEWIAERLAKMQNPGEPHEQVLSDGRWIMIEERRLEDGSIIGLRVDVTEMKAKEESFRLLFQNNPIPMFLYDEETNRIAAANDSACEHYGYRAADLLGMPIQELHAADTMRLGATSPRHGPQDGSWKHRKADGSQIEVAVYSRSMMHEGRPSILLAAIDITERRRSEARLVHMARHDALTNLPNRVLFRERVEAILKRDSEAPFAILLFDLDEFKGVNDTLGHSIGDKLLQHVARRIQQCLPQGALAARLGGDEFAIILDRPDVEEVVTPLVERIVQDVRLPFDIEGHQILIGASVGISVAPRDGSDPDRLLKNADLALYAAKGRGRGVHQFFEPSMDRHLQERRNLEFELRGAISRGELCVHYQPLVTLETGKIAGCEALVRWTHPKRGQIPPGVFIPVAEDTGLIAAIGQFVLRQACQDAVLWPSEAKVAVNLSPIQFKSCNVLETVLQALAASGLPPHRLELEITEALLLEKDSSVLSTLNSLRALGVGLSMDDFGTGYSSLSYLRNFPFTKIKIDQSFVRDLRASANSQAIVQAILSLGASFGMKVIAEGVEHAEDAAYLSALGCQEGQGYYFSKPKPAAEIFPEAYQGQAVARGGAAVTPINDSAERIRTDGVKPPLDRRSARA